MKRSDRFQRRYQCASCTRVFGILLACVSFASLAARGEDWPTYRHDIARSGITSERIETPLTERWVFMPRKGPEPAWPLPSPKPLGGILELPRVHFDDTFHVVVAGDVLCFGSSSENKVYCLNTSTGRIQWTKRLAGPVRLAPTIADNRVFVAADDGCAYCLNLPDGSEIWKFQAAPLNDKLLGNGKMISMWPVRSGGLVDEGCGALLTMVFRGKRSVSSQKMSAVRP